MTIPYERTLAVLYAGGFLTELHSDPLVPLKHRRTAVHIARHFPTVEDVEQMALLEFPLVGSGMFERPRDCPRWREHCPGLPLTYATRLSTPDEHGGDEPDFAESDEGNAADPLAGLATTIAGIAEAQEVASVRMARAFNLCVAILPSLRDHFQSLKWDDKTAMEWLCAWTWDQSGGSAALLITEGEGDVVLNQLRQMANGAVPS